MLFRSGLSLPFRVGHGAVRELDDQARIPDVVAVFQAGLGVGVVHRHDRDGHRVFGHDVDRDDVVRHIFDRVDDAELAVDEEDEPVIGVDVGLDRVRHLRLFQLAGLARRAFVLTLSQRDDRACCTEEQTADNCQTLHEDVL